MEGEESQWKEVSVRVKHITPNSIFEAIMSSLSDGTLKLPFLSRSDYTSIITEFFENLGQEWGYITKREYLTIDCPWLLNLQEKEVLALALEHENSSRVQNVLDSELRRLLHIKAHLKVIIYYPPRGNVDKDLKMIARGIRNQAIRAEGERWLVITGTGDVRDRKEWKTAEFRAFEIDVDGKVTEIGHQEFHVKDVSEEG